MFKPGDRIIATKEYRVDDTKDYNWVKGEIFTCIEDEGHQNDPGPFKNRWATTFPIKDGTFIHPNLWNGYFELYQGCKFKIGDIIECINNKDWKDNLTIGKKYEVLDYNVGRCWPDEPMIEDDEGFILSYRESRFKLVEKTPKFKKGDKVIALEGTVLLHKGQIYEIIDIKKDNRVIVNVDDGGPLSYDANWFMLVEKTQQNKIDIVSDASELVKALNDIIKVTTETHDRAYTALSQIQEIALKALRG